MAKIGFKPGNMLYPLPAVLISCGSGENANLLTVAWAGTVCTNPPMVSISVRPERHSYPLIKESGEFVINLTTKELAYATDYCGVRSGRDVNKWKECHLTPIAADTVSCPLVAESPVNIECQVTQIKELGSHHMIIANVTSVHVDDKYIDEKNTFHLNDSDLIAYSHGTYFTLGEVLGTFGYSIRKKNAPLKSSVRDTGLRKTPSKNTRSQKKANSKKTAHYKTEKTAVQKRKTIATNKRQKSRRK